MAELLPCPFCGVNGTLYASSDHSTAWEGGCSNDECAASPHVWELDEARAIAAWNRRASPAAPQGAARMPLSEEQIQTLYVEDINNNAVFRSRRAAFVATVRAVEAAHGIALADSQPASEGQNDAA